MPGAWHRPRPLRGPSWPVRSGVDVVGFLDEAVALGLSQSGGRGFDSVLITADTKDNGPIELAGELARDRGVVVAVGRGRPGRPAQDLLREGAGPSPEPVLRPRPVRPPVRGRGRDYPYGYVRWTEQRNMEAFADLIASGTVKLDTLITHRFPIQEGAAPTT